MTLDTPISDILDLMAERIPSSTLIMRAVPAGNGKFHALYSAPGLIPEIAKTADGRPYEYNSEMEAEWGAGKALVGIFNSPRIRARQNQGRPERYAKISGPEFAMLLQRANITPTFLAYLAGTTPQRVLTWIDGTDNCPHPIRVMLELFIADEKNIDRAEVLTDGVTTERRPAREAGE